MNDYGTECIFLLYLLFVFPPLGPGSPLLWMSKDSTISITDSFPQTLDRSDSTRWIWRYFWRCLLFKVLRTEKRNREVVRVLETGRPASLTRIWMTGREPRLDRLIDRAYINYLCCLYVHTRRHAIGARSQDWIREMSITPWFRDHSVY